MPHRLLSLEAVAELLQLTPAEVEQRVKDGEIPHEQRGRRIVFSKEAIDVWASQRVLRQASQKMSSKGCKSTRQTRDIPPHEPILPALIKPAFIAPALAAKTKASVLRELAAVAAETGNLNDKQSLITSLEAREALCSTGMPGGFALPHPRVPDPYLCEISMVVLGRTVQQIPFGAPDGQPTDLFFLICCQDDRLHLHALSRLCLVALKTPILEQLRQSPDAESMHEKLLSAETEALKARE